MNGDIANRSSGVFRCLLGMALGVGIVVARPLDEYPSGEEVWLGSFGAEVEVHPVTELLAPRSGEIQWLLEDGATVREGEAMALGGAVQLRQGADQLALDEANHELKLRTIRWNHFERGLNLARQVEELEGQLAKLEISEAERRLLDADLLLRLEAERVSLREQVAVARERNEPAMREEELRLELEQAEHDLRKSRNDHQELLRSLELLAEHDGILRIRAEGYVRPGDVVGSLERRGHAAVVMQVLDPMVRAEPPEKLELRIVGTDGESYRGVFDRLERLPGVRLGPVTYHFRLDAPAGAEELPAALSGERMATVYRLLEREARLVPKAQFLFEYTAEIQQLGWAGFVRERWPDSELLYVGPRSLAIAPAR